MLGKKRYVSSHGTWHGSGRWHPDWWLITFFCSVCLSTFCLSDKKGCVPVTVYNMVQGGGVKIGDSVAIPEPFGQMVHVKHKDKVSSLLKNQSYWEWDIVTLCSYLTQDDYGWKGNVCIHVCVSGCQCVFVYDKRKLFHINLPLRYMRVSTVCWPLTWLCVWINESERERERVCVCVCVHASASVCVCVLEGKGVHNIKRTQIQFSWRWYLSPQQSPQMLHTISQKCIICVLHVYSAYTCTKITSEYPFLSSMDRLTKIWP